jgi:hypothetical protein
MPCSSPSSDLVMAEYITVLVANGRTSEGITEEMLERMCAFLWKCVLVLTPCLLVIGPDYGSYLSLSIHIILTHSVR